MMNISWWMEMLSDSAFCSIWDTQITAENLQNIYMNFGSMKKACTGSGEVPIYNEVGEWSN